MVRSPEQVALDLPLAGPMSRALAFSVDLGLLFLLQLALFVAALFVLFAAAQAWGSTEAVGAWLEELAGLEEAELRSRLGDVAALFLALTVLAQFVCEWGYFVACERALGGRSPGKALLGLRVVRDGGLPLTLRASVVRNLLRMVDMLPTAYLVGLVSMVASREHKRLGDHAAGTLVIRTDRPAPAPPVVAAAAPGAAGGAADAEPVWRFDRQELRAVGPDERRLLRQTLRRAEELEGRQRDRVLERTVSVVCGRLGRSEPVPAAERAAFLACLLGAAEAADAG